MQHIRLYRFSPSSQPPPKINKMNHWFNQEVSDASIQPVDTFQITEQGPVNGKPENLPLALRIYNGMMQLKKAFESLKNRF